MDPSNSDPDALLVAVERIGFLEWRLDQAALQLESERAALGRERQLVAAGAQREARAAERIRDLEARLAEARTDAARLGDRAARAEKTRAEIERRQGQDATGERIVEAYQKLLAVRKKDDIAERALTEARTRIDRLERQQERFFERLVRWQHAVARHDRDAIDLAELIAELRNETLRLSAENGATKQTNQVLRETLADHAVEAPDDIAPAVVETSVPRWLEAPASSGPRAAVDAADARDALETIADPIRRAHALACFEAVLEADAERAPSAVASLVRAADDAATAALVAFEQIASSHEARTSCLEALGRLGGTLADGALTRAALDDDWRIRATALEAQLQNASDSKSLERGLTDDDARVRRRTVLAAASATGFDPVPHLLGQVDDPDPQTRRAVLTAIGERGDDKALFALTRALLDDDRTVRVGAARVLERRLGVTLSGLASATTDVRRKRAAALRETLSLATTTRTRGATWST